MDKYNLVILTSEEKDSIFEKKSIKNKTLETIHGKYIFDWIIEAYHNSKYISKIIVIGPDELEKCSSMRYVNKRIKALGSPHQNLMMAINYIKLNKYSDQVDNYLISFCDSVLLNTEILNKTIQTINKSKAKVALNFVEKNILSSNNFPPKKTYFPMNDKNYIITNLYCIKKTSSPKRILKKLLLLKKLNENPENLSKTIGSNNKDKIEKYFSKQIKSDVKIFESSFPEMGLNINKTIDFEFSKTQVQSPWKHKYKKTMIIYNPQAGQSAPLSPVFEKLLGIKKRKFDYSENSEKNIKTITKYLSEYGIQAEVTSTQYAGQATEIAKDCVQNQYDLVIAVGGDGTINEVVNGLANSKATLGIIPFGTANVLSIDLKLPLEIKAACQVIAEGKKTEIDLGKINERYFIAIAGVGFDAHVIKKIDSKFKKIFGALSYVIAAFTQFITYRFKTIVIKIDDQPVLRKGYMVLIGNGKFYGGELTIATHAQISDGYLDVCILKYKNFFSLLYYFIAMKLGTLEKTMSVEYYQCKKISIIKTRIKHSVHVDAEYLCKTPVDIKVCPKALTIAV